MEGAGWSSSSSSYGAWAGGKVGEGGKGGLRARGGGSSVVWGEGASQSSQYFDACSVLDSLAGSVMAASAHSLFGYGSLQGLESLWPDLMEEGEEWYPPPHALPLTPPPRVLHTDLPLGQGLEQLPPPPLAMGPRPALPDLDLSLSVGLEQLQLALLFEAGQAGAGGARWQAGGGKGHCQQRQRGGQEGEGGGGLAQLQLKGGRRQGQAGWGELAVGHCQVLELVGEAGSSPPPPRPPTFLVHDAARQAADFVAVPGRLPQEPNSLQAEWQLTPGPAPPCDPHPSTPPPPSNTSPAPPTMPQGRCEGGGRGARGEGEGEGQCALHPWPFLCCGPAVHKRSPGTRPALHLHITLPPPPSPTPLPHASPPARAYGVAAPRLAPPHEQDGNAAASEPVGGAVELLPVSLWLAPEALARLEGGLAPWLALTAGRGALSPQAAPAGSARSAPHRPSSALPELDFTLSLPHLSVMLRLQCDQEQPSPSASVHRTAGQMGREGRGDVAVEKSVSVPARGAASGKVVYVALQLYSATHRDHVSLQRLPPHQGLPLLRLSTGRQPDQLVVSHTATAELAATRLRVFMLQQHPLLASHQDTRPPPPTPTTRPGSTAPARPPGAPHTAAAPGAGLGGGLPARCWLEMLPEEGEGGGHTLPPPSCGHSGGGGAGGGLGVGQGGLTEGVPAGCGLLASLTWVPDQAPDAAGRSAAERHAASRCSDHWEEGEEGEGQGQGWPQSCVEQQGVGAGQLRSCGAGGALRQ
ncbi:hypothetical protein V8C86DRAFT_3150403, partial [Haematococcus lacustris]